MCPASGLYAYPDVIVVCAEPKFLDDERDTLSNPTVIVEVLSKSTESYDRGKKFELYGALPSLAEYVMISSMRLKAERFTREPNGTWNYCQKTNLEDSIHLKSVDCNLLLADVYEKIDFASQDPSSIL